MITEIIFASNNKHKVAELQAVMPHGIRMLTLEEAGIDIDIPEPHPTLEENAREKAVTIHKLTGKDCFSEDTGLEVLALNGEPGVRSARYAGEEKSFEKNTALLLSKLEGTTNREARFRAVICLIWKGSEHFFEGICNGQIIEAPRGDRGFGYDPVFVPEGSTKTFGEMTIEEKNEFNHRRKAADKLIHFLQSQTGSNE